MDFIEDNEILYRSSPDPDTRLDPPQPAFKVENGILKVQKTVFNDRNFQPSVDRKKLTLSIKQLKQRDSDKIFQLMASDVRKISLSQDRFHDIQYDPTETNKAHSLIMTEPKFGQSGTKSSEERQWKKFKERLAIEASKYGLVNE